MRIGVVSDTHDHRANVATIVELFAAARIDQVVHTGDITTPETLELLARLPVPLFGVYGNNDVDHQALRRSCERLGLYFAPPPRTLLWAERRVLITHDPELLPAEALHRADVLLHGHDHRFASERQGSTLRFNPGECAGQVPGLNSIGVLDLATLETERIRF